MESVATRRLIDASASLGAADRALLNLWVNRGLEDAAVARMTGMEPSAIAERRGRIVARLSEELGLPPDHIAEALTAIAASQGQDAEAAPVPAPAVSDNGRPGETETDPNTDVGADAGGGDASLNGHAPAPEGVILTAETQAPETADAAAAGESPRSRRRVWARVSLLVVAVIALVVVLLVTSGSDPKPRRAVTAARTHTVAPTPVPQTNPSPSPTVSRPQLNPLGALPGGVSHASGSLVLSGKHNHLTLRLTVKGLPAAHSGHYEVWLYNTVIIAKPLARLRNGVGHLVIRLPRRSARFHWIDVSFQPVGLVYHSGESVLRAANPARGSPHQLRTRSHRTRQLRRAINGSNSAIKSK